jgi:uncharacterized protein
VAATNPTEWGFYGRREQLSKLREILQRRRFFFLKVTGRRRIGKTSLVREALELEGRQQVLYFPVPDSDPAGVVASACDFLEAFHVDVEPPRDLRSLAACVAGLLRRGYILALDEFQYFSRKPLYEFNSHLQAEVDVLASQADRVQGGLIVLGSIHTEMSALLEDRNAPLFNRLTDTLELGHLDIESVLEILDVHAERSPSRLLFLWNLFEGVPKFYRDCFEQGVLSSDRQGLLRELFFSSASPLRTEAENWFLRELRGRYDLVLKYIARHPGCTNGEVTAHARSEDLESEKQVGGYLKILREKYQMVEQLRPVFSKATSKNSRYYIRDNFLRSWLAALATPVASITFRPIEDAIADADKRLCDAEGAGLERLAGILYEERARKRIGDFALTSRVQGFWDSANTQVDLVAIDEARRVIRVGSCKRDAQRAVRDIDNFEGHAARFVDAQGLRFAGWKVEKTIIGVEYSKEARRAIESRGIIAQDLSDLTQGL